MSLRSYITRSSKIISNLRKFTTKSPYERDEEGKKERIIHGQPYPDWRTPWGERDGEWYSKFRLFQQEKNPSPDILKFMQDLPYTNVQKIKTWWAEVKEIQAVQNQIFLPERVEILGANLAAIHFITYRGGSVRLRNTEKWIKGDPSIGEVDIPNKFKEGYYVEAVDCSTIKEGGLRYEGLENLKNLPFLKWLNLSNNIHVDDWCLDRIAGQNGEYLEYLNVTGCSITHNGIFAFARMPNLKVLEMDCKANDENMLTGLALLEEEQTDLLVNCKEK